MNIVYNKDCMIGMREYPDRYFDLAIVDPPYGDKVKKGGYTTNSANTGRHSGVANFNIYHTAVWNQGRPDKDYFDELFRVSKNQIIWVGNYFSDMLHASPCWIVWDKKRGQGCRFAKCELAWGSFDRSANIFHFRWDGMLQEDMKNKEKRIHPTQKPVALYEWLLENYAKAGQKILDTHVGSGSSRIACHKLGFDFIGYEIDEQYFKDQEKRYKEFQEEYTIPLF